jgi:glycyl-tRNA synthetase
MFLAMMSYALVDETVPDAQGDDATRTVLKLHPALAPVKCAVLPLVRNKEELVNAAEDIYRQLKVHFTVQYDDKDAIGRRYRRQDAIGTPYCVTVDFDTLTDQQVTVRDRDTLEQVRLPISEVAAYVDSKTNMRNVLALL